MTRRIVPPSVVIYQPVLMVWALFILSLPFYVARAGMPKPADALMVVLALVTILRWDGRLQRSQREVMRRLIRFTIWVVVVGVAWIVILSDYGNDDLFPLYYSYNVAVFLTALILYRRFREAFLRVTLNMIFVSVLVQVAASFIYRRGTARDSIFFDNPNQLGYYALLAACIVALMRRRLQFGLLKSSFTLICCGYLAVISASRSAVAGIAILSILLIFSNPKMIIMASAAAIILVLFGGPFAGELNSLSQRVADKRNSEQSFFDSRGYDRILANKQYLLLGAGEQTRSRFANTTAIGGAEIHSSAGTLLFSYGIVGVVLFATFLWSLLRGATVRSSLILMPPLVYTLAHQGLRFTMLWVLLALFLALKTSEDVGPS